MLFVVKKNSNLNIFSDLYNTNDYLLSKKHIHMLVCTTWNKSSESTMFQCGFLEGKKPCTMFTAGLQNLDLGSERKWGMGQRVHGGRTENKKKRMTERWRECGSSWLWSRIGCGWPVEQGKTALTGNFERKWPHWTELISVCSFSDWGEIQNGMATEALELDTHHEAHLDPGTMGVWDIPDNTQKWQIFYSGDPNPPKFL